MNRARALIIVMRPQDYAPARLREAARYLLDRKDATEEASEAIEWPRSKRDEKPVPETGPGRRLAGRRGRERLSCDQFSRGRGLVLHHRALVSVCPDQAPGTKQSLH